MNKWNKWSVPKVEKLKARKTVNERVTVARAVKETASILRGSFLRGSFLFLLGVTRGWTLSPNTQRQSERQLLWDERWRMTGDECHVTNVTWRMTGDEFQHFSRTWKSESNCWREWGYFGLKNPPRLPKIVQARKGQALHLRGQTTTDTSIPLKLKGKM